MGADTRLILIAAGGATVLVGLVWRYWARRIKVSRLEERLRFDDEPADRARAGHGLVELGLPRAAKAILRGMAQEPDARVRLSIALAIIRCHGELGRAQRVANVRGWAIEELEFQGHPVRGFGPAFTGLTDTGGPPTPNPQNGNSHGNGNGNGPGSHSACRRAEAEPSTSKAGADAIRWVAPSIGDRTEP